LCNEYSHFTLKLIMKGTPPKPCRIGGHPAPDGASPTQPYKCGPYFKVKIKVNFFISAKAKINDNAVLTLILTYRPHL